MMQKIGQYQLKELLGKGSISTVYLASDASGRDIALKVMEETPFIESEGLLRIIENARQTQKMSPHPKIVRILDFGHIDKIHYVSMDLVVGPGALDKIMESQSPLDRSTALHYALDIADALDHAHSVNIVHGDLKPGNILINDNQEAILNDFGCVSFGAHGSSSLRYRYIGTPKYMSPEQAQGVYISTLADIYSFGVLLYEMLTGRLPYDLNPATNIQKMARIISETPPVPPQEFNPALPNSLNLLLLQLLEKDEELRIQRIREVRSALKTIMENGDDKLMFEGRWWTRMTRLFTR